MGFTWFLGRVGLQTGYLGDPKEGNIGHVFSLAEIVSSIKKGMSGIQVIRSHEDHVRVLRVI